MKHTPEFTQPQLQFDEVHYITLAKHAKDITGQRFGRLVALGPVVERKGGQIMWLCRCDCGNLTTIRSQGIRSGRTQSCGCFHRELVTRLGTTHGLTDNPLRTIWSDIIKRCTNPNATNYKNYGGRGISICDEWRHDFQAFFDHVTQLPHCGEKGYSIDRIDNDGNYEPNNVRFATKYEQSHNSRRSTLITYNGETKCIADWARSVGMKPSMLSGRLRRNMSIKDALSTPSRYKSKTIHSPT